MRSINSVEHGVETYQVCTWLAKNLVVAYADVFLVFDACLALTLADMGSVRGEGEGSSGSEGFKELHRKITCGGVVRSKE